MDKVPTSIKIVLLPITFPLMILAVIYNVICELGEGVWERMILLAKREW